MANVITSEGLGLFNSQISGLGQGGTVGQNNERVSVNAVTGNLIIQQRDQWLVGQGINTNLLRTYNSQGNFSDPYGAANFRFSFNQRILNHVPGVSVERISGDGYSTTFTYDAATQSYISTDGDGAHDTLVFDDADSNSANHRWVWTEGSSQVRETYALRQGEFKLVARQTATEHQEGRATQFNYHSNGFVEQVIGASGQTLTVIYDADDRATSVQTLSDGVQETLIRYGYNASGQLASVSVDLTPEDNSIADGAVYLTHYEYKPGTDLISRITQSDQTVVAFTYDAQDRVQTVTYGEGDSARMTRYDYHPEIDGLRRTDIIQITDMANQAGLKSTVVFDSEGKLKEALRPALEGGLQIKTQYHYDGADNLQSMVDGRGHTTQYSYDSDGNLLSQVDAEGNRVTRVYDDTTQQLLKETVSNDNDTADTHTTHFAYDEKQRLRFVIDGEGRVQETRYDDTDVDARVVSTLAYTTETYAIDPSATVTVAELEAWVGGLPDASLQRIQRVDTHLDFRGQIAKTVTYTETDVTGAGVLNADTATRYFIYDAQGNLIKEVDPRGNAPVLEAPAPTPTVNAPELTGTVTNLTLQPGEISHLDFEALGVFSTDPNEASSYTVSLSDASPLPDWFTLDAAGHVLTLSPTSDLIGENLSISVLASNSAGDSGPVVFDVSVVEAASSITINLPNTTTHYAPVVDTPLNPLTLTPPLAGADAIAISNIFSSQQVEPLSYTVSVDGLPAIPDWVQIEGDNLSLLPTTTDAGLYTVRLTATDSQGLTAQTSFTVTIEAPATPNTPPTVSNTIEAVQLHPGDHTVIDLEALGIFADTDSNNLSYSLNAGAPNWVSLNDGKITLAPTEVAAPITLTVTASDGSASVDTSFDVTVVAADAPVQVQAPAEPEYPGKVVVVDTGGNGDYLSLADAISGEKTALSQPLTIRLTSTSGLADTTPVIVDGFSTTLENSINIIFEQGYKFEFSAQQNVARGIFLKDEFINLIGHGGKVVVHSNGYDSVFGVTSGGLQPGALHRYEGLVIEGDDTNTAGIGANKSFNGIRLADVDGTYVVINNTVSGFKGTGAAAGIFSNGSAYVYNNTSVANQRGLRLNTSTGEVFNNLLADNVGTDYQSLGVLNSTGNNLTSDGSSPDIDFSNRVVAFADPDNGDYRLLATDTAALNQGVDLSASAFGFTTDQTGGQRNDSAWDIGAFELSVSAPGVEGNTYQPDAANHQRIVLEAEGYHEQVEFNSRRWEEGSHTGASGSVALQVADAGTNIKTNIEGNSPRLDYQVDFQETGTYYIWVRGQGVSDGSDSIHVGMNGQALSTSTGIANFDPSGQWVWSNSEHTSFAVRHLEVTEPGLHTINVWMREDGFIFDKLVLTQDAAYIPSAEGPPASSGSATPSPSSSVNNPPTVALPNIPELNAGDIHSLDLSTLFSDADGSIDSYEVFLEGVATLPGWINWNSPILNLNPTGQEAGTYTLRLAATDDTGLTTETTVQVVVNPTVTAPSAPAVVDAIADISLHRNTVSVLDLSKRFEGAESYQITIDGNTNVPAWVSLNGHTLTLSPVAEGAYAITVVATSEGGTSDPINFNVNSEAPPTSVWTNVGDQVENLAPDATQLIIDPLSAGENDSFNLTDYFADPEGNLLTFGITLDGSATLPGWVTWDTATHQVTLEPTASDYGQYTVRLSATDDQGQVVHIAVAVEVIDPTAAVAGSGAPGHTMNNYEAFYVYDGLNRLTTRVDELGYTTTTAFNDTNSQTVTTYSNGRVTEQVFNRLGELISLQDIDATDPANLTEVGSTQYFYDKLGRLTATLDDGVITHNIYDAADRLIAIVDGTGAVAEFRYNENDQVIETVERANLADAAYLQSLVETADGVIANIASADFAGLNVQVNSAEDRYNYSIYDGSGRLVYGIDAEGFVTETHYDAIGNIVGLTEHSVIVNPSDVLSVSQQLAQPGIAIQQIVGSIQLSSQSIGANPATLPQTSYETVNSVTGTSLNTPTQKINSVIETQYLPVDSDGDYRVVDRSYEYVTDSSARFYGSRNAELSDLNDISLPNWNQHAAGFNEHEGTLTSEMISLIASVEVVDYFASGNPVIYSSDDPNIFLDGTALPITIEPYGYIGISATYRDEFGSPIAEYELQSIFSTVVNESLSFARNIAQHGTGGSSVIGVVADSSFVLDANSPLDILYARTKLVDLSDPNWQDWASNTWDYFGTTRPSHYLSDIDNYDGSIIISDDTFRPGGVYDEGYISDGSYNVRIGGLADIVFTLDRSSQSLTNLNWPISHFEGVQGVEQTFTYHPVDNPELSQTTPVYERFGRYQVDLPDSLNLQENSYVYRLQTLDANGYELSLVEGVFQASPSSLVQSQVNQTRKTVDSSVQSGYAISDYLTFDQVLNNKIEFVSVNVRDRNNSNQLVRQDVRTYINPASLSNPSTFNGAVNLSIGNSLGEGDYLIEVTLHTLDKKTVSNNSFVHQIGLQGSDIASQTSLSWHITSPDADILQTIGNIEYVDLKVRPQGTSEVFVSVPNVNQSSDVWSVQIEGQAAGSYDYQLLYKFSNQTDTQIVNGVFGVADDGEVIPSAITAHDLNAALIEEQPESRHVTRNLYDKANHLTATLDAEGYLTTFTYNGAGQLTETLTYAQQVASWDEADSNFDAELLRTGTLSELLANLDVNHSDNQRTIALYNARGEQTGEVDAEGYVTTFGYDVAGNLVEQARHAEALTDGELNALITNAGGIAYLDVATLLAGIAPSSNDQLQQWHYNSRNELEHSINVEGVKTEYTYNEIGLLTEARSGILGEDRTEERINATEYDVLGRTTNSINGEDGNVRFIYDSRSRIAQSIDDVHDEAITSFYYDEADRLRFTVNPLGEVTETVYNAFGEAASTRVYAERLGATELAALTGGELTDGVEALFTTLQHSNDSIMTSTYTQRGQVDTVTDAENIVTDFDYNAFGELKQLTQAINQANNEYWVETYRYDRRGQQTEQTRFGQAVDPLHRLNSDPEITTLADYDAFGRIVKTTDGNGQMQAFQYDRLGRQLEVTNALNHTFKTTYDAFGRILTQTDARGQQTTYAYDDAERSLTVTTPEGIATKTTRNTHGETVEVRDGNNQITTFAYDLNGNLTHTTDAENRTVENHYDAAGLLIATTDANGVVTEYKYDPANRLTQRIEDAIGLRRTTDTRYDAKGQQLSVTDANGVITTTHYDKNGRVSQIISDDGGENLTTTYTYDGSGNQIRIAWGDTSNPNQRVTDYEYDAHNRRIRETVDPDGDAITTRFTYDYSDNVISRTDASGNVTRFIYDDESQLRYTISPDGYVSETKYDANGKVFNSVAYKTKLESIVLDHEDFSDAEFTDFSVALEDEMFSLAPGGLSVTSVFRAQESEPEPLILGNNHFSPSDGITTEFRFSATSASDQPRFLGAIQHVDDRLNDDYYIFGIYVYGTNIIALESRGDQSSGFPIYPLMPFEVGVDYVAAITLTDTGATFSIYDDNLGLESAVVHEVSIDASTLGDYQFVGTTLDGPSGDGSELLLQNITLKQSISMLDEQSTRLLTTEEIEAHLNPSLIDQTTYQIQDKNGRTRFSIDAEGYITEQVYDDNNQVIARISYADTQLQDLGITLDGSQFADDLSALLTVAEADQIDRFVYDSVGQLRYSIDAEGYVSESVYDANGNVLKAVRYANSIALDDSTLTTPLTPSAINTLLTDAGQATYAVYDAINRPVFSVDALGYVTETHYDSLGNTLAVLEYDQAINTTGLAADNDASLIQNQLASLGAEARSTRWVYDNHNQARFSVDALGYVTETTYDALGQIIETTQYEDAPADLVDYTEADLEAAVAGLEGRTTQFVYNEAGRLRFEVDALNYVTESRYDSQGNLIASTRYSEAIPADTLMTDTIVANALLSLNDTQQQTTQYVYDANNRLTHTVNALGYVQQNSYDAFGNIVRIDEFANAYSGAVNAVDLANITRTSTQDQVTVIHYDKLGQRTSIQNLLVENGTDTWRTESYRYDAFGNRTAIVDKRGNTTTFAYNERGELTRKFMPRDGSEVANIQDRMGYVVDYAYDAFGNRTDEITYMNPVKLYHADNSLRTAADLNLGTVAGTNIVANTDTTSGDRHIQYSYDALNRLETITAADGVMTRNGYDAYGNIRTVTEAEGTDVQRVSYFEYNALDQLTEETQGLPDAEQVTIDNRYTLFDEPARVITLKVKSDLGASQKGAHIFVKVDGKVIGESWVSNDLLWSEVSFTFEGPLPSNVEVEFDNPDAGRQFYLDWIKVDQDQYEAEATSVGADSLVTAGSFVFDTSTSAAKEPVIFGERQIQRFAYSAFGELIATLDPRAVDLLESNDAWARKVRMAMGLTDQAQNLTTSEREFIIANYTTQQDYDALGRKIAETDAKGYVRTTEFDAFGNTTKATDPNGHAGYFFYNQANELAFQVDPAGYVTQMHYNAQGSLESQIQYHSAVVGIDESSSLADLQGLVSGVTNSTAGAYQVNARTDYNYDSLGQLVKTELHHTDANGNQVNYTELANYDAAGNRIAFADAKQSASGWDDTNLTINDYFTYEYDAANRLIKETTPSVDIATYNASTHTVGETAQRIETTREYDAVGNVITVVEAANVASQSRTMQYQYDKRNREVLSIGQAVTVYDATTDTTAVASLHHSKTFDALGQMLSETQQAYSSATNSLEAVGVEKTQWHGYDNTGRKRWTVNADHALTTYDLDAAGNPVRERQYGVRVTPALNGTVDASVAALILSETDDYRETQYYFDAVNQEVASHNRIDVLFDLDAVIEDGGNLVNAGGYFNYYKLQRKTYDGNGNLLKTIDGNFESTFVFYDSRGNKALQVDPLGYVTAWEYDYQNNVTRETKYAVPLAETTLDGLKMASDSSLATYDLSLLVAEAETDPTPSSDPNTYVPSNDENRVTEYVYDNLGRRIKQVNVSVDYTRILTNGNLSFQNGQNLTTQFAYDGLGNITRITQPGGHGSLDFSYDALGRKTKERLPEFQDYTDTLVRRTTAIAYNAHGEYLQQTVSNGINNVDRRITKEQRDAAGNVVRSVDAENNHTFYKYDAYGNVTQDRAQTAGYDDAAYNRWIENTYSYDALDREVNRTQSDKRNVAEDISYQVRYNAYGDIQAKGANHQYQEQYVYDKQGNLFKTNNENGTWRVYRYDANGNATMEMLAIDQFSLDGTDISLQDINNTLDVPRLSPTDVQMKISKYDARGQVVSVVEPPMEFQGLLTSISFVSSRETSSQSGPEEGATPVLDDSPWNADTMVNINAVPWGISNLPTQSSTSEYWYDLGKTTNHTTIRNALGLKNTGWTNVAVPGFVASNGAPTAEPQKELAQASIQLFSDSAIFAITDQSTEFHRWELVISSIDPALAHHETLSGIGSANRNIALPASKYTYVLTLYNEDEQVVGQIAGMDFPNADNDLDAPSGWVLPIQGQEVTLDIGFVMDKETEVDKTVNPSNHATSPHRTEEKTTVRYDYLATAVMTVTENSVSESNNGGEVTDTNATFTNTTQNVVHREELQVSQSEKETARSYGVIPSTNFVNKGNLLVQKPGSVIDLSLRSTKHTRGRPPQPYTKRYFTLGTVPPMPGLGDANIRLIISRGSNSVSYEFAANKGKVDNTERGGWSRGLLSFEFYINNQLIQRNENWSPVTVPPAFYLSNLGSSTAVKLYSKNSGASGWQSIQTKSTTGGKLLWINPTNHLGSNKEFEYHVKSGNIVIHKVKGRYNSSTGSVTKHENAIYITRNDSSRTISRTASDSSDNLTRSLVWTSENQNNYIKNLAFHYIATEAAQTADEGFNSVYEGINGNIIHRQQRYNAFGEIIQEVDGRRTTPKYDASGELVLDENGNVVEETTTGNATNYRYNNLGNLVEKVSPETDVYDAVGNKSRDSLVTSYYYNELGEFVAERDARSHADGIAYYKRQLVENGQVVKEWDRIGATNSHEYDIHGNRRETVNEIGQKFIQSYDALDNLIGIDRYKNTTTTTANRFSYDRYTYDRFNNRTSHTNALGDTERYYYDNEGRIRKHISFAGRTTEYGYQYFSSIGNGLGGVRKITSNDLYGGSGELNRITDDTDYFGLARRHNDLGNHEFVYQYNEAGWLQQQTANTGITAAQSRFGEARDDQHITYEYYANGYLKRVRDDGAGTIANYQYDKNGNRIFEAYWDEIFEAQVEDSSGTAGHLPYQTTSIYYDELNRMKHVRDPRFDIDYGYDANGNRKFVHSTFTEYTDEVPSGERDGAVQDFWYKYDREDRFTITMGRRFNTGSGFAIDQGNTGYSIGYTLDGQRAYSESNLLNEAGQTNYRYEQYAYDDNRRVDTVFLSEYPSSGDSISPAVRRAKRHHDAIGNMLYAYQYNSSGAVVSNHQYTYDKDSVVQSDILYTDQTQTKIKTDLDYFYLADGRTLDKVVQDNYKDNGTEIRHTITTDYQYDTYDYFDTYKTTQVIVSGTGTANHLQAGWKEGNSDFHYNGNGHNVYLFDGHAGRSIDYVTNHRGMILLRTELNNQELTQSGALPYSRRFYFANNRVVGDIGTDMVASRVDYAQSLANTDADAHNDIGNRVFPTTSADFDQNFQPINPDYPGKTPGYYTTIEGDSLQSVALSVWGDSELWYLLADANGLVGGEALPAGLNLVIPNVVTNIHNNADTFRPYDVGLALGDTNPTLPDPPPPPRDNSCGFKQIFVMVVAIAAIVAAAIIAPYAVPALANAIAPAAAAGTAAAVGATVAAGAIVAAGTAIAVETTRQLASMAVGLQDGFDFGAVARSAIVGGITGGVAAGLGGLANLDGFEKLAKISELLGTSEPFVSGFAQAAISSMVQTGVDKLVGGNASFSWRNVAIAGISSGITKGAFGPGSADPFAAAAEGAAAEFINIGVTSAIYGDEYKPNPLNIINGVISSAASAGFGQVARNDVAQREWQGSIATAAANSAAESGDADISGSEVASRAKQSDVVTDIERKTDAILNELVPNVKVPTAKGPAIPLRASEGVVSSGLVSNVSLASQSANSDETQREQASNGALQAQDFNESIIRLQDEIDEATLAFDDGNFFVSRSEQRILSGGRSGRASEISASRYRNSNNALADTTNAFLENASRVLDSEFDVGVVREALTEPDNPLLAATGFSSSEVLDLIALSDDQVKLAVASALLDRAQFLTNSVLPETSIVARANNKSAAPSLSELSSTLLGSATTSFSKLISDQTNNAGVVPIIGGLVSGMEAGRLLSNRKSLVALRAIGAISENQLTQGFGAIEGEVSALAVEGLASALLGGFAKAPRLVSGLFGAGLAGNSASVEAAGAIKLGFGKGASELARRLNLPASGGVRGFSKQLNDIVSSGLPRPVINARRGNLFERAVLETLGLKKSNNTFFSFGEAKSTVPDLPTDGRFGITDVKDVITLSNSKQLRAQLDAAETSGLPFNVIISSRTQRVSQPLLDRIDLSRGKVIEFNPDTGAFTEALIVDGKVVR